jgi:hypothetical protein
VQEEASSGQGSGFPSQGNQQGVFLCAVDGRAEVHVRRFAGTLAPAARRAVLCTVDCSWTPGNEWVCGLLLRGRGAGPVELRCERLWHERKKELAGHTVHRGGLVWAGRRCSFVSSTYACCKRHITRWHALYAVDWSRQLCSAITCSIAAASW